MVWPISYRYRLSSHSGAHTGLKLTRSGSTSSHHFSNKDCCTRSSLLSLRVRHGRSAHAAGLPRRPASLGTDVLPVSVHAVVNLDRLSRVHLRDTETLPISCDQESIAVLATDALAVEHVAYPFGLLFKVLVVKRNGAHAVAEEPQRCDLLDLVERNRAASTGPRPRRNSYS